MALGLTPEHLEQRRRSAECGGRSDIPAEVCGSAVDGSDSGAVHYRADCTEHGREGPC